MFLFVFQTELDESQIDAAFKNLFRQLAGPVSILEGRNWFMVCIHTVMFK